MNELTPFPLDLPAQAGIPMVDTRPDTTRVDTEAALAAWEAAIAAIDVAWKITPGHMLRNRMTVPRGEFNQGIALQAAHAMRQAATAAIKSMDINARARASGTPWAAATDAEAVAKEVSA